MSTECNSNPSSGCTDTQTYTDLSTLTSLLEVNLTAIVDKKLEIIALVDGCNTDNNAKFQLIIDAFQAIIDQAEECCEEIQANLQNIITLLGNVIIGEATTTTTSTTLVPASTTTTTTGPTTTTTTGVPTTTTSTTLAAENEGDFVIGTGTESQIVCLPDPYRTIQHLHYAYAFGEGTVMYIDGVGGVPLTGSTYIMKLGESTIYNINPSYGIVGAVAGTCEY